MMMQLKAIEDHQSGNKKLMISRREKNLSGGTSQATETVDHGHFPVDRNEETEIESVLERRSKESEEESWIV